MRRAVVFVLVLVACGSRTQLDVNEPLDASIDAEADVVDANDADVIEADSAAPTILTLATGYPYAVAADDTDVYWTNIPPDVMLNGAVIASVLKCAMSGCGSSPTVVADQLRIFPGNGFAIDATNVYWGTTDDAYGNGRVMTCPKTGCVSAPTILATNQRGLNALAVNATTVFWDQAGDLSTTIVSCSVGGCDGVPTPYATNQPSVTTIALDGANAYWTTWATVVSCPLAGCTAPMELAAAIYNPASVAVADPYVYWLFDGAVRKCAVGGCGGSPTTLASKGGWPLAVDGLNVYWASAASIEKCSVDGCNDTPTSIAQGFGGSSGGNNGIAVNATNVFWSTTNVKSTGAVLTTQK
jgi:hypothetical protein